MDHLKNEGPSSAHFDFSYVEAEAEKSFKKRALAVRLATEGHNLGNGQFLAKGDGGSLQSVVGFESSSQV